MVETMTETIAPAAHPRYQELPPLSSFDFQALKDSIAEYGMLEPVVVDEEGHTLDGHHRMRAVGELRSEGVSVNVPEPRVLSGLTDDEKRNYALMVNLARRQMSIEQKRELWRQHHDEIRAKLIADPTRADSDIAGEVGVTPKTVGKQRRYAVADRDIPATKQRHGGGRILAEPAEDGADSRTISNHLGLVRFVLAIYYPAPSSEERTRKGLPYSREAVQDFWQCERTITSSPPTSTDMTELGKFFLDIAQTARSALIADPMSTMVK